MIQASGTFTLTAGNMNDQRYTHTATLLVNGTVLLTGGTDTTNSSVASAELSIHRAAPSRQREAWALRARPTGNVAQRWNRARRRRNRRKWISLVAAELYGPGTGQFAPTGSLQSPRYRHTATLLGSGNVLVTGGANTAGTLATAELYQ